jgi:hypothetical protein
MVEDIGPDTLRERDPKKADPAATGSWGWGAWGIPVRMTNEQN